MGYMNRNFGDFQVGSCCPGAVFVFESFLWRWFWWYSSGRNCVKTGDVFAVLIGVFGGFWVILVFCCRFGVLCVVRLVFWVVESWSFFGFLGKFFNFFGWI